MPMAHSANISAVKLYAIVYDLVPTPRQPPSPKSFKIEQCVSPRVLVNEMIDKELKQRNDLQSRLICYGDTRRTPFCGVHFDPSVRSSLLGPSK